MSPGAERADGPALDSAAIIAALDRHGVQYLLIGGVAATVYGADRVTYDIDCLPRLEDGNLERLAAALGELNARMVVDRLTDEEAKQLPVAIDALLKQSPIVLLMTDAGRVDVLHSIPDRDGRAVDYDQLRPRAEALTTAEGVRIRVAALSDIIASKEHADRPKDREALPELRALHDARAAAMRRATGPPRRPAPDANPDGPAGSS